MIILFFFSKQAKLSKITSVSRIWNAHCISDLSNLNMVNWLAIEAALLTLNINRRTF